MNDAMKRLAFLLCLASSPFSHADETLVRTTEPRPPEAELAALSVPDGFEIRLFAAEPQINKPINLAYDSRGRLWVSSTVEYPYAAKRGRWVDPQGSRVRDSRDAIKILEDTDGDGRADRVSDFADGLNIPTGVLPWHRPGHRDGCIAWSIPNIWYFADTIGDGKADHREVLFGPLGYERDTHGMCSSFRMGSDGWVYATHGFNNTSRLRAKDGTEVELHSGSVFRFRPDGSSVEVFTRGQVNPFGLCFDRRGNLYSADCHSAPVYQLLQGGVYPSFGKPHDGLGFAPKMIGHTHGSTGICGIVYIDRDRWGTKWNDHILIGNPVTSRVNLDRVEFRGTTPVAIEKPDFVTSEDPWFRPVDLCHGGDGALYVADFYNRIIGHYEVPLDHPGRDRERGRIWKITRRGEPSPLAEPQPSQPLADPIQFLGRADPFTRRRAANQLRARPEGLALGPLLGALANTPRSDTHLRHVLRMAIRNHFVRFPDSVRVASSSPRFAPEALDIAPAVATPEAAAALATSRHKHRHLTHIARYATRDVIEKLVWEIHGEGTAALQMQRIRALEAGFSERGKLEPDPQLLRWAQQLATRLLSERAKTDAGEWTARPHPEHPGSKSPWTHQTRQCADGQEATIISSLRIGEGAVEQRTGTLKSIPFPAPAELSFWIVGHRGSPDNEPHQKSFVALVDSDGRELHRAYPPRSDVAEKVTWKIAKPEQPVQIHITDGDNGHAYAWLGIARITGASAISTADFQRASRDEEALSELAQFLKLNAPVALREQLKPYLPAPIVQAAENKPARRPGLDRLIADRIAAYRQARAAGRLAPEKGASVFKQHCAACHQIGREGGVIGPQLDGIGKRGIERLAEDILDPDRNVDAHFYLTRLQLHDGTRRDVFVLGERGEAVRIRELTGEIELVPKSAIQSRDTVATSLMPATFDASIAPRDLLDLLAWLTDHP